MHAATLAAYTGYVSYSSSTMYCLSTFVAQFGISLIDSIFLSPVLYFHLRGPKITVVFSWCMVRVFKKDGTYFVYFSKGNGKHSIIMTDTFN